MHVQAICFQAVGNDPLMVIVEAFDVMMRHHVSKVIGSAWIRCTWDTARVGMDPAVMPPGPCTDIRAPRVPFAALP